ncbi:MAG: copper resistance protein NlpE N-terminal domain-containing protein [Saprospiraceae bacterium]|nr:copper resistance protein NlpE N-terminal domain-containing protein [Saprospiraceae bacterium]
MYTFRSTLLLVFLLATSCSIGRYHGPTGSFHGLLPCADCPGIACTLTLNADQTYSLEQRNMDREIESTITRGSFQYKRSGRIVLTEQIAGMNHLQVVDETLVLVDDEGQQVRTEFPENYILKREVPEQVTFDDSEDIFFKATGNEPFWMVEIKASGTIHFSALGPEEIDMALPLGNQDPSEAGVLYTYGGAGDAGRIEVITRLNACEDDMSGEARTHTVTVNLQLKDMESPVSYTGCGYHPSPYRLHDIWELVSINGETFDTEGQGIHPYLIMNGLNSTATGSGGCNRINGTFLLRGKTMTFGPFISTKRACPLLDLESRLMESLSGQTWDLEVNEQLTLTQDGQTIIFRPKR